jgi:transposase InsO family protein
MDRRLAAYRRPGATGRYGRTKPGTLLKHHIPLRTDRWDVTVPGFSEIDLVAHCGESGDGEFAHSLNLTDIHTTWVETRAVLGRGQHAVQQALEAMRQTLPFRLQGIDSDNGSEFINAHLVRYCQHHAIQFTRGRPYKKDDNAHIEQKNWTHVRKLVGYLRYDSPETVAALNALYQQELRLFQNLFLPSVKLVRKTRVGARIQRVYDRPQTPFERVQACPEANPVRVAHLQHLRATLDPFALAEAIDVQLARLAALAHHRAAPRMPAARTPTDRASAAHRPRETRPPIGALRTTPSRSGAAPVPAPRQNRVTSLMARRSGGK